MNVDNKGALNVKVQFRDDIRRFNFSVTAPISLLKAKVQTLFSIPAETSVNLLYRDDENDLVTMSLEEEMQHAIQVSKGILRLEVRITGEPQPQPQKMVQGQFPHAPFDGKPWRKMWKHHQKLHGGMAPFGGPQPDAARGPHPFGGHHHPHPFGSPLFPGGHQGPYGHHGHHGHHGHGRPEFQPEIAVKLESDQDDGACATPGKLKARHVKDVTIPDGTSVMAGVPFIKTWRVRNVGGDWPANVRLIFISHKGDQMGGPEFAPVQGPVLSGAETDISVNLVAPQEPGDYSGFWRMATEDGKKFGQRLWVSIKVVSNSSSSSDDSGFEHVPAPSEYEELCKRVEEMGFEVPKRRIEHLLRKFGGNVNTVAEVLTAKREGHKEGHGKRHGCGKRRECEKH